MSQPKKTILVKHPVEWVADVFRYMLDVRTDQRVVVQCASPDLCVRWLDSTIEILNYHARTSNIIPRDSSNTRLLEAVQVGLHRKCYPEVAATQ